MGFCSLFPGFLAIAALLLLARELTMQLLQLLFRLAVVAWIVYRLPFRIGVVGVESHINPDLLPCGNMLYVPLRLDAELDVVAIGTADDAYPFDVLDGECSNLLLGITYKPQAAYGTAISEEDMFPVRYSTERLSC